MIVWLASYPRSGNTMIRLALRHLCRVNTWSIYDDSDIVGMGAAGTVGHVGRLAKHNIENARSDKAKMFVKTHNSPMDGDTSPAIHIVRDGRDALVSYAHYMIQVNGDTQPFVDVLSSLVSGKYARLWGSWSGHARRWMDRPVPTARVRYEDMLQDVRGVLKMALDIVDYDVNVGPEELMPQFGSLNRKWPEFFRSGGVGSWKTQMPERIHREFWQHHGHVMEELGYS